MTTTFTADQPSGIYAALAGAIIPGLIYHLLTDEHRPYAGIPIVSLEPPRGFKSWLRIDIRVMQLVIHCQDGAASKKDDAIGESDLLFGNTSDGGYRGG